MSMFGENGINLIWSGKLIYIWNEWEVRFLVLLSLLLQVILSLLGSQRKRTTSVWIRFLVWCAYLSADWVATVALGVLAKAAMAMTTNCGETSTTPKANHNSSLQIQIQSIWAPFLLLHLGGPDAITAYSLEDNELWPRHLLGLVIQVGVAFYVLVRSWGHNNSLNYIAIPIFISGIMKYGERTWVIWSSSSKHFRKSLLPAPDPGPDYVEIVEENLSHEEVMTRIKRDTNLRNEDGENTDNKYYSQAKYLFEILKVLFANLILGFKDAIESHSKISSKSSEEAFALVEVELGFFYDVLYTKARITYSWYGIWLRCISFMSSASALVAFWSIMRKRKPGYTSSSSSSVDSFITYLLLVGALVLEVYALVLLISSDWTKLWLEKHGKKYSLSQVRDVKRCSRTIAQYNLMRFCLLKAKQGTSIVIQVKKLLGILETLEQHQNVTWQNVDERLEEFIFLQLVEKSKEVIKEGNYNAKLCKELLTYRGDNVVEKMECLEFLKWSIVEVEFDHSLLLWHIATELCYHDDIQRLENIESCVTSLDKFSTISRRLSDYMLYLLVMCPTMLPQGIGELRYRDTCADAIRFLKQRRREIRSMIPKSCELLLKVPLDMMVLQHVKGDLTKSVLFEGCRLANQLQSLYEPAQGRWSCEKKWEMMNKVWLEMLAYTAIHCGWKDHVKQLKKGGELLSHVCLLMGHVGLSDRYQKASATYRRMPTNKSFNDRVLAFLERARRLARSEN